jgi:hypothetical protein
VIMSPVALLPLIGSDACSMSQWAQIGCAAIGSLACARIMLLACSTTSMFSLSSLVSGRSMNYRLFLLLLEAEKQKQKSFTNSVTPESS